MSIIKLSQSCPLSFPKRCFATLRAARSWARDFHDWLRFFRLTTFVWVEGPAWLKLEKEEKNRDTVSVTAPYSTVLSSGNSSGASKGTI